MNRALRFAFIALLALPVLAVGSAGAAQAHSSEVSASPEEGAVLDVAPSEVRLGFDSFLMDVGTAMVVTGPAGVVVSDPKPTVDGSEVFVAVDPAAAPGTYTVAYRITSEDGHSVTSTYEYTVRAASGQATTPSHSPTPIAETATTTPVQSPSSDTGIPVWIWGIGIVGVIALVVALVGKRR